ncbi:ABC transporter permease [Ruminiclostridium cellulolyticum]|uniref:Putative ABC transporter, peremase protein n=1 Tax=Ruminiclostridium cellulolyticum (strain ATCC 35319 / DSM 5812 / JCM 6584 / H10) TaxID=394503 RepID=B8I3C2_RUMCH|nr:ABC transporter permease [Ruminiclostridium cellulolyticum]ACL76265.1 putative ABC transporter, peremase protein [Ruminiclostridium cellulolyticum H10]
MLGKLLKYEVKDTSRIIPFFYAITAVLAGLSLLSGKLELGWFKVTSSVLLLLVGIAVFVVTLVVICMRFYKNLYSNEGYLSFTLPLKPHLHLISKAIVSFIWMILSVLICLGAFYVALYGLGVDGEIWSSVLDEIERYGMGNYIYLIIPMVCLSILYLMSQIYFSITLANRPQFHNMGPAGASILLFLATNVALQIVETIITIIIPLSVNVNLSGSLDISLTTQNMVGFLVENINNQNPSSIVIGLGGYIFDIIMICVLFYLTGRMMNKKVSLR